MCDILESHLHFPLLRNHCCLLEKLNPLLTLISEALQLKSSAKKALSEIGVGQTQAFPVLQLLSTKLHSISLQMAEAPPPSSLIGRLMFWGRGVCGYLGWGNPCRSSHLNYGHPTIGLWCLCWWRECWVALDGLLHPQFACPAYFLSLLVVIGHTWRLGRRLRGELGPESGNVLGLELKQRCGWH